MHLYVIKSTSWQFCSESWLIAILIKSVLRCWNANQLMLFPALLPYSLICIVSVLEAEDLLLILGQQMSRMQSGKGGSGSFRSSFQEDARRRYRQRMQEEYEEEMERVVWSSVIIFWVKFSA